MITLHTLGARGDFFATRSIGETLSIILTAEPSRAATNDLDEPAFEAEVVEQRPDDHQGDVQFVIPGITPVGGTIATLFYSDGESLCLPIGSRNVYVGVAPVQD